MVPRDLDLLNRATSFGFTIFLVHGIYKDKCHEHITYLVISFSLIDLFIPS